MLRFSIQVDQNAGLFVTAQPRFIEQPWKSNITMVCATDDVPHFHAVSLLLQSSDYKTRHIIKVGLRKPQVVKVKVF